MKTEKGKDPNVSLEEARKECETHIEIMEKLKTLECHFEQIEAEDSDGIFYYDQLVNNMLKRSEELEIAQRQNHDEILLMIQKYVEMYQRMRAKKEFPILSDDVQVIIAQRNNAQEMRTYLSYLGFGESAQHVIVDRGDHDELMYYIERHGFVPEVQKKLWERDNKEEISLHLLKHGLCQELEAKLLDDGNLENFKFWISLRHLPEGRQKKLLESGSSEFFYAYIARHNFSYCFDELLIEKRSTQEVMDYLSKNHFLTSRGICKLLKKGDHDLIMHYISFLNWSNVNSFIREFNASGRKNDEELVAAHKKLSRYAYSHFQKNLIQKGDVSAFVCSLDKRLDPETEKFLAKEGCHDIIMAYIERYPLEMYALREFFNRNNPEEAAFYCQKWQ